MTEAGIRRRNLGKLVISPFGAMKKNEKQSEKSTSSRMHSSAVILGELFHNFESQFPGH